MFILFNMGVDINEAGGNDPMARVNDLRCLVGERFSDREDLSVLYCHITIKPTVAGTINDAAVSNKNITGGVLRNTVERQKQE